MDAVPHIEVRDLSMAYGDFIVQRGLDFVVNKGDIFVVMGGNGCGKTTLMRALVGLQRPAAGSVLLQRRGLLECADEEGSAGSSAGSASCSRAAPCGVR
jgi:phospholipid/cholesterol/gamma-HCH transport system ATP-binding protein